MGSKSTEAYLLWYDILNRFTVMLAQRSAQLLGIVLSWMKAKFRYVQAKSYRMQTPLSHITSKRKASLSVWCRRYSRMICSAWVKEYNSKASYSPKPHQQHQVLHLPVKRLQRLHRVSCRPRQLPSQTLPPPRTRPQEMHRPLRPRPQQVQQQVRAKEETSTTHQRSRWAPNGMLQSQIWRAWDFQERTLIEP